VDAQRATAPHPYIPAEIIIKAPNQMHRNFQPVATSGMELLHRGGPPPRKSANNRLACISHQLSTASADEHAQGRIPSPVLDIRLGACGFDPHAPPRSRYETR
jgi:hypothetical protein